MIARKTSLKRSKFTLKKKSIVRNVTGVKAKKKKVTKADLLRAWYLPEKYSWSNLRYKNPYQKGIYWYFLSLEIRNRDVQMYGTCISCDKPIEVDTCQAGHFIAAHGCGRDLLFDFLNLNAECPYCNGKNPNHLFGYERNLAKRYGKEAPALLKDKYYLYQQSKEPTKDWSAKEYEEKIRQLNSFQQAMHSATENNV